MNMSKQRYMGIGKVRVTCEIEQGDMKETYEVEVSHDLVLALAPNVLAAHFKGQFDYSKPATLRVQHEDGSTWLEWALVPEWKLIKR